MTNRRELFFALPLVVVTGALILGFDIKAGFAQGQAAEKPVGVQQAAPAGAAAAQAAAQPAQAAGQGGQAAQSQQAGQRQAASASAQAEEQKFRPRLPNYYAQVVTEEQRQKIYDIQRKYFTKIETLRRQLEALIAERDKEIEAVLTPEQKAKIEKLRKEAAERRAARRDENAGSQPEQ